MAKIPETVRYSWTMAKFVVCKCGSVIAVYAMPDIYWEEDWLNDIREYLSRGATVLIAERHLFHVSECTCDKK